MSSYPLPNLFIPGVQKAGTTALASFLAQHPDICLVEGKEAHVFDDPQYHRSADKLSFARDKYAGKLAHYNGEKYILDATPITMLHPQFIMSAARTCKHAKYIVMLRDPVERALSHYAMTKSRGLEARSPAMAFLLEPWRMRGFYKNLPTSPFESKYRDQSYLIRGLYSKQLKILKNYVSTYQVMCFEQNDLAREHTLTLKKITNFLEIAEQPIEPNRVFESDTSYRVPSFFYTLLMGYYQLVNSEVNINHNEVRKLD
ncbi:sulfotransferase family protein [Alteromonas gilva]|uniref:Sulfotransferase n=1 Tax=Alteromonas gilva TaxID=2987522 RepID=A0ABT5L8S5_9ALTE|nr:sulfotransferase [Alteromonas gilva]MDC8833021.1 sulfotransferase [Alteromonas gilva]